MKPLRSKFFLLLLLACSTLFFYVKAQIHDCLDTFECAAGKRCSKLLVHQIGDGECGDEDCDSGQNRCVPKLGLFRRCSQLSDDCCPGLYCTFDVPGRYSLPVCAPMKKIGEPCSPTEKRPCENHPKVRCNRRTNRCEVFIGRRLNDQGHSFADCLREEGFFCNSASKKCAPRKPDGAECGDDLYECSGFCVEQTTLKGRKRVFIP